MGRPLRPSTSDGLGCCTLSTSRMRLLLKPAVLLVFLFGQLQTTAPGHSARYVRSIDLPASASNRSDRSPREIRSGPAPISVEACTTLDAEVFSHAAPLLKDLRIYTRQGRGETELPFVTTLSEPLQQEGEEARVLNAAVRGHHLVFDLEMPRRPYTDVLLSLNLKDFLAAADVAGESSPGGLDRTPLGTYSVFDLTTQHLARDLTLPLPESTFPYLHIELRFVPVAGRPVNPLTTAVLQSVAVPPSREDQTLYVTTQQTSLFTRQGSATVALFHVPVHVPIERISFVFSPAFHSNFSRVVEVTARSDTQPAGAPESLGGTIFHVHLTPPPPLSSVDREELHIPAAIGSNMQHPATLRIAVEGDPLPLTAVGLEMRQRRLRPYPHLWRSRTIGARLSVRR